MKKTIIVAVLVLAAILLITGCKAAEPEGQAPEELITQYSGIITEVNEDEIIVYEFTGYNGEMLARTNEETKIDDSLRQMIKPDNLITFTTDGIMTRSIPPQVNIVSVDSILEDVVFEGTVSGVMEDAIEVDITYPRTDRMIARITPDTVFAEGVSEDMKTGSTIRFETTGLMQPSEPAQMDVVRFVKNELSEIQSDFIQKKIDKGIDFYATGNEPSWSLDINLNDSLIFTTMSGFELHIPIPESIVIEEDGSINFESQTGDGTIRVIVSKGECTDTMSGEEFNYEVSVEAKDNADKDFKEFEGCGKYLTDFN